MVTTTMSGYYAPSYMPSARPTTGASESKYMASLPAQLMASVGSNASSTRTMALTGMNSNVLPRPVAPIMVPNMARGSMPSGVFLNMAHPRPVLVSPSPTMAHGPMVPHSMAQVMVPRPMAASGMVGVPGTIPYVLKYVVPVPAYNNSELNPTVATPGLSSVGTGSQQPFVLRPLGQQGRPSGVIDHGLVCIFTLVAFPTAATISRRCKVSWRQTRTGPGRRRKLMRSLKSLRA